VVLSRLQAGANHQGSQTNLFYTAFSGFIVHPSSRVKSQSGQFGKSFRSLVTHSKTGISSSRGSGRASCSEHSQLSSTVTKPREATKPRSHQATKPRSTAKLRHSVRRFSRYVEWRNCDRYDRRNGGNLKDRRDTNPACCTSATRKSVQVLRGTYMIRRFSSPSFLA
jgi:hypothetical protein